jgi:hypothetical protein
MYCNSYAPWSGEDIETLDQLYKNDIPLEQIAKVLDRSPRAVEHALKNLLVQNVIRTSTRRTAVKYGLTKDTLTQELVPEKYYVEDKSGGAFVIIVSVIVLYLLVAAIGFYVGYT